MADEKILKIGALMTLSGGVAPLGQDSLDGAEAARRVTNRRGGVQGRQVHWVVADAKTPEGAALEAERMITDEGIRAIVGCYGSDHTIAASKVCERLGAVLFVTTAWTAHLFDHRPKFTFRVNNFATTVEEAAVSYVADVGLPRLRKTLGQAHVVIVHESSGYGRSCAEEIVAALGRRGATQATVLAYDYRYGAGTFDASALARRINQARPDVLFASSFVTDAVELVGALVREDAYPPLVMTSSAGFGLYTLNAAGPVIDGILSANAPARVAPEALSEAGRVLQAEYLRSLLGVCGREPSGFNAMAFCASWALFNDVLPRAASLDSAEDIRVAAMACDVPEGDYPNGWGLRFDEHGQNTRCPSCVDEWRYGRLHTAWPASLATTSRRFPELTQRLGHE